MKIKKSYLQNIIKEELLSELKRSTKSKNVLEEKKIYFKFLLNGREHLYDNYDVKKIVDSYTYTGKPEDLKRDLLYGILNNLIDHPELNKQSEASGEIKNNDLLRSYNNLYGEEVVKMAYDLVKNKQFDKSDSLPDDPFIEINEEYRYRYVARYNVIMPTRFFSMQYKHIDNDSGTRILPRHSLLFAIEQIQDIKFPTSRYGKYLTTKTLKEALFSEDPEQRKKYNGFFPIALYFTNVLTDTVDKKYRDCNVAFYNGTAELTKAKQISDSLRNEFDIGDSIIDNLNFFINNLAKKQ